MPANGKRFKRMCEVISKLSATGGDVDGRYTLTAAELATVNAQLREVSCDLMRLQRGLNTAACVAVAACGSHDAQVVMYQQVRSIVAGLVDAQCALTEISGSIAFNAEGNRRIPQYEEY